MMRKTVASMIVAAFAFAPAYVGAQADPNQSNCRPMIRDAQAELNKVENEQERSEIMDTLDKARLELRQRDYGACVNLAQLALDQIERHENPSPGTYQERRERDSAFEQPETPEVLKPENAPKY